MLEGKCKKRYKLPKSNSPGQKPTCTFDKKREFWSEKVTFDRLKLLQFTEFESRRLHGESNKYNKLHACKLMFA